MGKSKIKIAIILGTRPEIIKMSPIIRECERQQMCFFILHTNQHYLENLDKIFFKELGLPKPKYNLNIESGTQNEGTGKMLISIEKVLIKEKPDIVLVQGDTNTVLAGALAAVKLHIKIGHVEAGLRSYFRKMPEEINRILTDHCSDLLFTPTKSAQEILLNEGIDPDKIFITGNTIVDAVYQNMELARNSSILKKMNLEKHKYFLATVHRPENVDKKQRLESILKGLELIYKELKVPIVFPVHPRTEKMISKFKLEIPKGAKLIKPVGYLDFLQLEANTRLVLTDSGGIQEEACILKIPCLTLRDNTERPETLDIGGNSLVGANSLKILEMTRDILDKKINWSNPFGSQGVGKRIIEICESV